MVLSTYDVDIFLLPLTYLSTEFVLRLHVVYNGTLME